MGKSILEDCLIWGELGGGFLATQTPLPSAPFRDLDPPPCKKPLLFMGEVHESVGEVVHWLPAKCGQGFYFWAELLIEMTIQRVILSTYLRAQIVQQGHVRVHCKKANPLNGCFKGDTTSRSKSENPSEYPVNELLPLHTSSSKRLQQGDGMLESPFMASR